MSELVVGKVFSVTWEVLKAGGYDVEVEPDQAQATKRLEEMGKPKVTPVLSGLKTAFTKSAGVAVFLKREGEDVVAALARFDDIAEESIASFAPRLLTAQYGLDDNSSVESRGGPLASGIRGRVVYFGDLFVKPGVRGSISLLEGFVTVLQIICHWKWQYDWMYAFLRQTDVSRGAAERYNFSNIEAMANIWINPPVGRSSNESLVAVSRGAFLSRMDAKLLQSMGVE